MYSLSNHSLTFNKNTKSKYFKLKFFSSYFYLHSPWKIKKTLSVLGVFKEIKSKLLCIFFIILMYLKLCRFIKSVTVYLIYAQNVIEMLTNLFTSTLHYEVQCLISFTWFHMLDYFFSISVFTFIIWIISVSVFIIKLWEDRTYVKILNSFWWWAKSEGALSKQAWYPKLVY